MDRNNEINERDKWPLSKKAKEALDREGFQQGTHPQHDVYDDQIADRGQEITENLAQEENEVDFPDKFEKS